MKSIQFKGLEESKIFIENEQSVMILNEQLVSLLEKTVLTCLRVDNVELGCEINLLITDDDSIRQINLQFRNIDHSTDVLSFPMVDSMRGTMQLEKGDFNMDEGLLLIGDIVISAETAQRQAEQYGHTLEREIAFLTSHGVFHLLGYDHMVQSEEAVMLVKQETVLEHLGLKRI